MMKRLREWWWRMRNPRAHRRCEELQCKNGLKNASVTEGKDRNPDIPSGNGPAMYEPSLVETMFTT